VRREDDRPARRGVIADGLPEVAPALHVHSLGRLVEDEQLRIRDQRHGEPQPLLLSPRALPDPPARVAVMPARSSTSPTGRLTANSLAVY
jgi:hypothetical protein